jgi:SAM-dependent methyltransferase
MDEKTVGDYWNGNAEGWTRMTRAGYDVYRDYVNTPGFLAILPEVTGLEGLDIGCGEGHNTRLLADRGAGMTALDIAPVFLRHAWEREQQKPQGIRFLRASALDLPFADATFDFATGFMSFMDIPTPERVVAEAYRVLKPGGFLQFSITHPCYDTPHRVKVRDEQGNPCAYEIGGYFRALDGDLVQWTFGAAPSELREQYPLFNTPRFTRTLSYWVNLVLDVGFVLERLGEPAPDDRAIAEHPDLVDARVVAYFLHIRGRKPC